MAEVEKININNTDYDIADAKALRNKDTVGTESFVDTKAGTTTYPTAGDNLNNSTVIGNSAYFSGSSSSYQGVTIIGNGAYANMSYTVGLGYMAHASGSMTTSVGYNANAGANQATVVGSWASANSMYGTAIGTGANIASGNYGTAVGYGTSIATGSNGCTALGASAGIQSSYTNYSTAVGYNAKVNASYAVQLGSGTNNNPSSLQFRDWPLVDSGGKIYEERIPSTVRFLTDEPTVLEWQDDDQLRKMVFMYTGIDNDLFTHGLYYQATPKQGHPKFWCSWTGTDYVPRNECVQIDNEKLFLKLAEISKDRIDNSDTVNSLVGGDNAEQSFYFYYNVNDAQWRIEIDSDAFEHGFTGTPDAYYFKQGETLEDFGIYVKDLTLPTDEGANEEIFDISYYAPVYCDGYDFGSDIQSVNYMQLMNAMCDGDWGFGYAIPNMEDWYYEVDGTSYEMPVIPEIYISSQDGDEYDGVTVRWEWDDSGDGIWEYYINGKNTRYEYTTAELEQNFGIVLDASEEDTEYIEFYFRGAKQLYWEQFNPIDDTVFAKQEDLDTLETQVQPLLDWKVNEQTRNMYNLNNYTTPGWYYFPNASNVTHRPSTVGIGFMLLVQKNSNDIISQHLFACVSTNTIGGTNYGYETSMVYSRVFAFNSWYAWQTYLTNGTMCNVITGYDKTKKQYLVHDANANRIKWEDVQ